jgi:hypothetical protein
MYLAHRKRTRDLCLRVFFLTVLFAAAGCAGWGVPGKVYKGELDRWTRSEEIYDGLNSIAFMHATYKTKSFREAYAGLYTEIYQLDERYGATLMERELDLSSMYNEFFVSFFTTNEKWNDLDREDSIWRLYLVDSTGARVSPEAVTRLEATAVIREFFPYLDLWSAAYSVKFPRRHLEASGVIPSQEAEYIRLIVTGVLGKGELEWRLTD